MSSLSSETAVSPSSAATQARPPITASAVTRGAQPRRCPLQVTASLELQRPVPAGDPAPLSRGAGEHPGRRRIASAFEAASVPGVDAVGRQRRDDRTAGGERASRTIEHARAVSGRVDAHDAVVLRHQDRARCVDRQGARARAARVAIARKRQASRRPPPDRARPPGTGSSADAATSVLSLRGQREQVASRQRRPPASLGRDPVEPVAGGGPGSPGGRGQRVRPETRRLFRPDRRATRVRRPPRRARPPRPSCCRRPAERRRGARRSHPAAGRGGAVSAPGRRRRRPQRPSSDPPPSNDEDRPVADREQPVSLGNSCSIAPEPAGSARSTRGRGEADAGGPISTAMATASNRRDMRCDSAMAVPPVAGAAGRAVVAAQPVPAPVSPPPQSGRPAACGTCVIDPRMETPASSAKILDGKAVAARIRADLANQVARAHGARRAARAGGGPGRRGSRPRRSTSATRPEACAEAGIRTFDHRLAAATTQARAAGADRAAQRRPAGRRDPDPAPAARRPGRARDPARRRSAQGRRRHPPREPGASGHGRTALRRLHAARRDDPHRRGRREAGRRRGGGGRALEHGRQADGGAADRRRRDRDCLSLEDARPGRRRRARRRGGRRRRPRRDDSGRLDQAGRRRHRRRHQSRRRRQAARRRGVRGRRRARLRDHARPGRRRPDDHRHAAGQYGQGRQDPRGVDESRSRARTGAWRARAARRLAGRRIPAG